MFIKYYTGDFYLYCSGYMTRDVHLHIWAYSKIFPYNSGTPDVCMTYYISLFRAPGIFPDVRLHPFVVGGVITLVMKS